MTTINFIAKEENRGIKISGARKLITTITTVVLAVYIIGVAGFLGWWWLTTGSVKKTSSDIERYAREIAGYSDAEVLVNRAYSRAKAINDFLEQRGNSATVAGILVGRTNVTIAAWDYLATGVQTVEVAAATPAEIKEFTDYLDGYYDKVAVEEILWSKDGGWSGKFNLSARKEQ